MHQVSVLCLATSEVDYRSAAELRRFCPNVEVVPLPRWRSVWNCLVALFSKTSVRCAYFYSRELQERVKYKVTRHEIDLVHAELLKSVPMVEAAIGRVPTVLDAVDCLSMFEARRRNVLRNPLLVAFSWMEWKRLVQGEARAAGLFNGVVISSLVDKGCYPAAKRVQDRMNIVRNGVDLEHFRFQAYEPEKNLIVFCAKLDYFANKDAALYFAGSIWPLLRKRRPELRFEIIGSRPPRSVRDLDGRDNIKVRASVADVRPHVGRAWIAVCPVRAQSGTQNKIIEAMALGVPVVATQVCCPGLGVKRGEHLLVADTPEEMTDAVEALLNDPVLRANLIQAGRAFVEKHHDWSGSVQVLCDAYAQATADFADHIGNGALSMERLGPRPAICDR